MDLWPRLVVRLERIDDNPFQTRTAYDASGIEELAADIARNGLQQIPVGRIVMCRDVPQPVRLPRDVDLVAWWNDHGGAIVQLAFGHRRLRAFRLLHERDPQLGPDRMPVEIRLMTNEQMAMFAWSENEQRSDLNALEQAQAIQRMIDAFGWTQEQAAEKLGLARPTVSNKLRLLRLPEAVKKSLAAGELSERQALALLPLAELPESVLKQAEENKMGWCTPSRLVLEARNASSDQIRRWVADMVNAATERLEGVPFVEHPFELRGVHAARCAECADRIRHGQELCCPDEKCLDKKAAAWRAMRLAAARAATGLPVVAARLSYDQFDSLHGYDPLVQAILAKGCPNLHLAYRDGSYHPDGFPDVGIICYHKGQMHHCQCLSAAKAAQARNDPERIAQRERAWQARQTVIEPATRAIAEALAANQTGVWRHILELIEYSQRGQTDGWSVDRLQGAVAGALVQRALNYQSGQDPETARRDLEKLLADLEIEFPWKVKPATRIRRRAERIRRWLEAHRSHVPPAEAVRGNLENLRELAQELGALGIQELGAQEATELSLAIEEVRLPLEQLLPLVEAHGRGEWTAEHLAYLVEYSVESRDFTAGLQEANLGELHYALAMAEQAERRRALQGRIEALAAQVR